MKLLVVINSVQINWHPVTLSNKICIPTKPHPQKVTLIDNQKRNQPGNKESTMENSSSQSHWTSPWSHSLDRCRLIASLSPLSDCLCLGSSAISASCPRLFYEYIPLYLEYELVVDSLVSVIDQLEGMRPVSIHVPMTIRNTAIGEQESELEKEKKSQYFFFSPSMDNMIWSKGDQTKYRTS